MAYYDLVGRAMQRERGEKKAITRVYLMDTKNELLTAACSKSKCLNHFKCSGGGVFDDPLKRMARIIRKAFKCYLACKSGSWKVIILCIIKNSIWMGLA